MYTPAVADRQPDSKLEAIWRYHRARQARHEEQVQTELRNRAVLANRGLVSTTVMRLRQQYNVGLSRADMDQLGYEGLVKAVERFDPAKGHSFSSYAIPFIQGAVMHHLRDSGSTVKIPRRWRELYAKSRSIEAKFLVQHRRYPKPKEMASALGCSLERWYEVNGAMHNQHTADLDDEIKNGFDVADDAEDCGNVAPGATNISARWQDIEARIATLSVADQELLRSIYMERQSRKSLARSLRCDAASLKVRLRNILDRVSGVA